MKLKTFAWFGGAIAWTWFWAFVMGFLETPWTFMAAAISLLICDAVCLINAIKTELE